LFLASTTIWQQDIYVFHGENGHSHQYRHTDGVPHDWSRLFCGLVLLILSGVFAPAEAQNANISSAANQTFGVGDPATLISTITITDDAVTPTRIPPTPPQLSAARRLVRSAPRSATRMAARRWSSP